MDIRVQLKGDSLKIYINSQIHLYINQPLIGFQSWKRDNNWWEIEFYTKDRTILVQYDCLEKWTSVLKELDKVL